LYGRCRLVFCVIAFGALPFAVAEASVRSAPPHPPCGARLSDHAAFVKAAARYAGKFSPTPPPKSFSDLSRRSKEFGDTFLRRLPELAPKSGEILRLQCLGAFSARLSLAPSEERVKRVAVRIEQKLVSSATLPQVQRSLKQAARDSEIVAVPGARFGIAVAGDLLAVGRPLIYTPNFMLMSTRTAVSDRGLKLTQDAWTRIKRRIRGKAQDAVIALAKLDALAAVVGSVQTVVYSRQCHKGHVPQCGADLLTGSISKAGQFSSFGAKLEVDDLVAKAKELAKH
jgi:hypothetical protein